MLARTRFALPLTFIVTISISLCLGLAFDVPGRIGYAAKRGPLTFDDRVTAQRAIEAVYWRHRIWPQENPEPKPSLDEVMPDAAIRAKVADYLRQSRALEVYWQRPVTAEQLQAEMERMAQHTNQPEVLGELWAALGNDPFVIAECLARPLLAERLLRERFADCTTRNADCGLPNYPAFTNSQPTIRDPQFDEWWSSVRDGLEMGTEAAGAEYRLPEIAAQAGGCFNETWTPTMLSPFPIVARRYHTAVWTGAEMIIWGGDTAANSLSNGGRYNPATDTWTPTNETGAPNVRYAHTAVWTGREMIVWGGGWFYITYLNTGGRYNPMTDTWTATTTIGAPAPSASGDTQFTPHPHSAVWTGSEMIVWGGIGSGRQGLNTGGRYNPTTNTWTATTTNGAPSGRYFHTAVWTGSEMIVWGGVFSGILNSGGRYNPMTDTWAATNLAGAPSARLAHTAVWTGSEMIVWGGSGPNTGGRYNPATDTWTVTSTTGAPDARSLHTAVWTGSEMIIWGGSGSGGGLSTGGRYNPATNTWNATSTTNAPSGRAFHTAVWTGSAMIIWGGEFSHESSNRLNTGAVYMFAPALTVSPAGKHFSASGGNDNVSVTAPNACSWTATSNADWLHVISGTSGNGNGVVSFSVDPTSNTSGRIGMLMIGPKTFPVTQAGENSFPPIKDGEYVTNANGKLILRDRDFRFPNGDNVYFVQPEIAYDNLAGVSEVLDKMVMKKMPVGRHTVFNDHPYKNSDPRCGGLMSEIAGNDPAAIQLRPGLFCEPNLVALDRAVAEAKVRNIRVILYFTNNFTAYGGIRRYVRWLLNREPANPQEVQLFYTDATIKGWYKNYVRMLLERTNTFTGVRYKDEPAILAWELGNELRNDNTVNGGVPFDPIVLLNWEREMSDFIKGIDRNHLVSDGDEGFDDDPTLYPGLSNLYAVRGDTGNSFHRMVRLPNIDLVSYHLYPSKWGLNDTTDVEIWIRVHEQLARAAGKVAYLGEYGKRMPDRDPPNCDRTPGRVFDPMRAQIFDQWLKLAIVDNRTAGALAWQMVYNTRPDCDGFAIYCPEDQRTCAVLEKNPNCPTVTNISPSSGAPGTSVTITGTGFTDVSAVVFTGVTGGGFVVTADGTKIFVTVPPGARTGPITIRKPGCADVLTPTFTVTQVVICTPPPPGLVSWWPGDGNANDIIDGNPGTLRNGASFATGLVGQAFSFDGVDDDVRVAASASLNVGAGGGLTIEAWINPANVSSAQSFVEWHTDSTFGTHFDLFGGTGTLHTNLVDTNGSWHQLYSASGIIVANTFQHVAVTYDKTSGMGRLYRNGQVVAEGNLGVFTPQTTYDMFIGRPLVRGVGPYQGKIDEVTLYSRALYEAEIQAIFNAGAAGKCKPPVGGTCPTVSGINPTSGIVGSTVTINGANFTGASAVRFANNVSANFTINSDSQITATVPSGAMTGAITISKPNCADAQTTTFTVTPTTTPRTVRVVDSSGSPGGTVAVPIELVAQGNENALGFSITFNTSILSNPQSALGSGAAGASLNVNPSQVAQGRLGLAIAMPAGQTFTAGVRQIVVVTFTIAAGATATSTPIGFGDQPIPREVVGVNANPLSATYTPGTVTISTGYEADVAPRFTGNNNGSVTIADWVQVGRFVAGLEVQQPPTTGPGSEFQRADCAPRLAADNTTLLRGNGQITIADWVQAGRYAAGLDPITPAGGPTMPLSAPTLISNARSGQANERVKVAAMPTVRAVNASLGQGQGRLLTFELDACGTENALGFSLSFDPTEWRFVSAVTGSDAHNVILNVNLNQVANGRVGFALALPARQTLRAGTRQLVVVRFAPLADGRGAGFSSVIGFADQPVAREVVDANAETVPANYALSTDAISTRAASIVSAASFSKIELPSEAIAAAFGTGLATSTQVADTLPLPTTLAGTTVKVRDSAGVTRDAPLFFVAPAQVNYLIPVGVAAGAATVTITSGDGKVSTGVVQIAAVAPGLFSANASGQGVAAGVALRVKVDGTQSYEPIAEFNQAQNRFVTKPIDLGPAIDQVFLILYGTGFRNRSALAATACKIGGADAEVLFAGDTPGFVGLDQSNVRLPRSLAGRGEVDVVMTVDGKMANLVRIAVK